MSIVSLSKTHLWTDFVSNQGILYLGASVCWPWR